MLKVLNDKILNHIVFFNIKNRMFIYFNISTYLNYFLKIYSNVLETTNLEYPFPFSFQYISHHKYCISHFEFYNCK